MSLVGARESDGEQHIGVCHFELSDLTASMGLTRIVLSSNAVPSAQLTMSANDAAALMDTLPIAYGVRDKESRSTASWASGKMFCPCTEGKDVCGGSLEAAGTRVYPPDGVTAKWYQGIISGGGKRAREMADQAYPVHIQHFGRGNVVQVGRKLFPRDGVLPRPTRLVVAVFTPLET